MHALKKVRVMMNFTQTAVQLCSRLVCRSHALMCQKWGKSKKTKKRRKSQKLHLYELEVEIQVRAHPYPVYRKIGMRKECMGGVDFFKKHFRLTSW